MTRRDPIQETAELNKIPIVEIGNMLGVALSTKSNSHCPIPDHNDSTPSFSIASNRYRWKCFGCGKSGGAIDLVMHVKGFSFIEAKNWLLGRSSMTVSDGRSSTSISPPKPPIKRSDHLNPDPQVLANFLALNPLLRDGEQYLVSRAFSPRTIKVFQLGQVGASFGSIRQVVEKFGYDRVARAGLLAKTSTPKNIRTTLWEGGVLVPFYENEQLVYLQSRSLRPGMPKWLNLAGQKRRLFNSDVAARNVSEVWLCEGVFDAISAHQLGHAAIGLLGVTANLNGEHIEKLRGKFVRIVMDWDKQGQMKAREIKKLLSQKGVTSIVAGKPPGNAKDLNEYLIERS